MKPARVAILDWSAARGARLGKDSIWLGIADADGVRSENIPTRAEAEARLNELADEAAAARPVLIGCDFAFGFPRYFAGRSTVLENDALAVWDWLSNTIADGPGNTSNWREVAARMNRAFPGPGPFWGNSAAAEVSDLPRTKPAVLPGFADHRACEAAARAEGLAPKSVFQTAGAGAVGAQALTGLPVLSRLRRRFGRKLAVWPWQDHRGASVVLAEVYPSMLSDEVAARVAATAEVPDEAQVRLLAATLWRMGQTRRLASLMALDNPDPEEGWILGVGHRAALRAACAELSAPAPLTPPRLRNDCFALPQGVDWVPVDAALDLLRAALAPVTATETVPAAQAGGRILSVPVAARLSHPPRANSAVDGYGLAATSVGPGPGTRRLPLLPGRAAAGQPFPGAVPPGKALRILTGAVLPHGVDAVVLEEDCATDATTLAFEGAVKPGANTRRAGEDFAAGATLLPEGHRLRAPDLALLAAAGVGQVAVHAPLRVAVLSTGDELADPATAEGAAVPDANRPMLLDLLARWGALPVDLGTAPDRPAEIARRLDRGAARADLILTSGGASAGDEDHMSRLLRDRGQMTAWRIAMKPGRPLALGFWQGVPVMGLPGNPVAAFVCALVFARPAIAALSGAPWPDPMGFTVPAAFAKRKKDGRREYLRARLTPDGAAEVFASEGSGRITGLSWATGLVELPHEAAEIAPGMPVRFLPYAGFGV